MKIHRLHRIYIDLPITNPEGHIVSLNQEQINYLVNVLRCKDRSRIRVFNEKIGEYLAILNITKSNVIIEICEQIRSIVNTREDSNVTLAQCIIKPERMMRVIDMATQVGVTKIVPIRSEYTQHYALNIKKYQKIAIEASRQSERLTIPTITFPITLEEFLDSNISHCIIYANEREQYHQPYIPNIQNLGQISVLIGPEGGFSDLEFTLLQKYQKANNLISIGLGANILRSETAAVCLLAQLLIFKNTHDRIY